MHLPRICRLGIMAKQYVVFESARVLGGTLEYAYMCSGAIGCTWVVVLVGVSKAYKIHCRIANATLC